MPAENHAHKHQLKPCPFCGSSDLTLDNLGQHNDWFVSCNICEIQEIANYTEAQAVALWNRRTPEATVAADAREKKLMMQLLPLVEIEGVGHCAPARARFLLKHGVRIAQKQKREGETDEQFLDRIDAMYAAFAESIKSGEQ